MTTPIWEVEIAARNTRYARYVVTTRFMDAWKAYESITITNGARKRLLRNGKVLDTAIAPRTLAEVQRAEQLLLPIAN